MYTSSFRVNFVDEFEISATLTSWLPVRNESVTKCSIPSTTIFFKLFWLLKCGKWKALKNEHYLVVQKTINLMQNYPKSLQLTRNFAGKWSSSTIYHQNVSFLSFANFQHFVGCNPFRWSAILRMLLLTRDLYSPLIWSLSVYLRTQFFFFFNSFVYKICRDLKSRRILKKLVWIFEHKL